MRTDFMHLLVERVGDVEHMPYGLALLVFLPLLFDCSANILGCDDGPCEASAQSEGYASVPQFMLTNTACWVQGCLFIYPTTYPVMLRAIKASTGRCQGWRRTVVGVSCAVGAYFYMAYFMGTMSGLVLNAIVFTGWAWKLALAAALGLNLVWNRWLFGLPILPLAGFYVCFLTGCFWVAQLEQ